MIYDARNCALGEGPMWHPLRGALFWFDILGKTLHSTAKSWTFDTYVSACGWVDQDTLLIASANGLRRFDLREGEGTLVVPLEADDPMTRSNDGRADPFGGFWIGTMGLNAEPEAGAIYRYFRGELRKIVPNVTVSNSICFAPDASVAYFADTVTGQIMRQTLNADDGWPVGAPELFVDLRSEGLNPDGAVVDRAGHVWSAQWGAGRVACYDPAGRFVRSVEIPASQATCPAFGGAALSTLFVTSAATGVDEAQAGQTFAFELDVVGQREHQVIL